MNYATMPLLAKKLLTSMRFSCKLNEVVTWRNDYDKKEYQFNT